MLLRMGRSGCSLMTTIPWSWRLTRGASRSAVEPCHLSEKTDTVSRSPCDRNIDLIRPFPKDMVDPPRESLRADAEPADKQIRDRKFLLNHFEAFMEGKLHAGEKYCEKDDNLNTGMSYLAQYWRMQRLIAFRISSGVLQASRPRTEFGSFRAEPIRSSLTVQLSRSHQTHPFG